MEDLFKSLGTEDIHGGRAMDTENQKILENAEHYGEDLANLEDELDELEADFNKGDFEKPTVKATMDVEKSFQKAIQSTKQPAAPAPSKSSLDSFYRTLYCRQKQRDSEKAFTFHKLNNDEMEKTNFELDLIENKAQFYFIDVQEDFSNKSRLLVFGKVKVKDQDPVSCCLVVNNMDRRYYFFKKENENVVSPNDLDCGTSKGRSHEENREEASSILQEHQGRDCHRQVLLL